GASTLKDMLTDEIKERITHGNDHLIILQSGAINEMQAFVKLIREAGKEVMIFQVWDENTMLRNEEDKREAVSSYSSLLSFCQTNHIKLAPAGIAYNQLMEKPPKGHHLRPDYLYVPEGIVQNNLGTMVNVASIYASLSGESPVGLPSWEPFDKELVKAIQTRTFSVYKNWQKGKIKLEITNKSNELAQVAIQNSEPAWEPVLKTDSKIYYVGNSYIGTEGGLENHFPRLLREVNSPYQISTKSQIFWGQGLQRMFQPNVKKQIAEGPEDLVVVTSGPRVYMDSFYTEITSVGKKMAIHMTWGRNPTINDQGMEGFKNQTKAIVETTMKFEEETGVPVIPCGLIFYDLVKNPPQFENIKLREDWVFMVENIHQNHLGTMINASAHYAVLTGQSPVGLPMWDPYPEELVRVLQERTWQIVKDWKAGKTYF
ncbi:MAG: hypothetical protein KDD63_26495, partial [Bacteroidetes bacterium]|nr:hypothetical protein [Bacteroidota bacterium]